jgi:hypothetical protein
MAKPRVSLFGDDQPDSSRKVNAENGDRFGRGHRGRRFEPATLRRTTVFARLMPSIIAWAGSNPRSILRRRTMGVFVDALNCAPSDGCYFIALGNVDMWYRGTLRVESRDEQVFASGDLYAFDLSSEQTVGQVSPPGPGNPIFPIAD